jgi:hypothetical protein
MQAEKESGAVGKSNMGFGTKMWTESDIVASWLVQETVEEVIGSS